MLSHRTGAQLLGLGPLQWHTEKRIFIETGSKMHGTQPLTGCLQGCYGACKGGLMQHTGYELPRIPVPRTSVNKGIKEGQDMESRPSPLLASVLVARPSLAFLLSAPQQVVGGPAHRVRYPAYRTCDRAQRSLRWRLVDEDLVLLHAHDRSAGGLRGSLANGDHCFVGGPQSFLALPEGHALQLPTLPATEGYEALEPFHLTQLRQEPLLDVALGVVHPIGGYLQRGYSYVHTAAPSSRYERRAKPFHRPHDAIVAWDS